MCVVHINIKAPIYCVYYIIASCAPCFPSLYHHHHSPPPAYRTAVSKGMGQVDSNASACFPSALLAFKGLRVGVLLVRLRRRLSLCMHPSTEPIFCLFFVCPCTNTKHTTRRVPKSVKLTNSLTRTRKWRARTHKHIKDNHKHTHIHIHFSPHSHRPWPASAPPKTEP